MTSGKLDRRLDMICTRVIEEVKDYQSAIKMTCDILEEKGAVNHTYYQAILRPGGVTAAHGNIGVRANLAIRCLARGQGYCAAAIKRGRAG